MGHRIANLLILLAAGAATMGCVLPKQVTTRTHVGTIRDRDVPGSAGSLKLTARVDGRDVFIHAERPRSCKHDVYAVMKVRRYMDAEVGGLDGMGDPRALVLAFPVLVLSGLFTGVVVAASGEDTWTEHELRDTRATKCPVLAGGLPVQVTLASGAVITASTDVRGNALVSIPKREPDAGTLVIRSDDTRGRTLHYDTRGALLRIAQARAEAVLPIEIVAVVEAPAPPPEVDTAASLTRRARAAARAGDCATFEARAEQVRALDRGYYNDVLAISADARACLQP